jgi:putative tricarboxylic transport membrane protein
MGIATCGSVAGSLFGVVCLALLTPSLGEVALSFGAFEFFWLALFGVMMSGSIAGSDPLKGWLMGFAGLFVTLIGQDGCTRTTASPSATTICRAGCPSSQR